MHSYKLLIIAAALIVATALPSYAQFPESIEAQREYMKKRSEEGKAKKQTTPKRTTQSKQTNTRSGDVKDSRHTKKPSSKDPRSAKPSSATDTRNANPSKAYQLSRNPKPKVAACDITVPRDCSESLAKENRSCSDKAKACKDVPSSKEDQSCAVMRCDIDKAECMKEALDDYISCMDSGLEGAGAN